MGQTALGDADSASLQQEIVDLRAELARKEEEIAQLISRLQVRLQPTENETKWW